jgi:hypothetical protein
MILRYTDTSPEGKERTAKIKLILPEKTLVESFLMPKVELMYPTLLKMLYAELEIYRAYPKKPLEESGKAKVEVRTFDPRNHLTCFQGKAFRVKDNSYGDADLVDYRKAVGTFNHAEWGDATLMEIWGGDHFKHHQEMVTSAFKYGAGITKTRPKLKFHVNPLFMNGSSGVTKQTDEQKQYAEDMDLLLAKAMTWGVRTQAESNRAESARRVRNEKAQLKQNKKDEKYNIG